jgi:hypothetical protein
MEITTSNFPSRTGRLTRGYDFKDVNGAIYFFIPVMLYFIISVNEILNEKDKRLRHGITVMGLKHFSYWFSWILT